MMSDPTKLFRTVTDFTIFDNNLIGHAREVFDDYIEKGLSSVMTLIIINGRLPMNMLMLPFYSTSIPFNTNGSISLSLV